MSNTPNAQIPFVPEGTLDPAAGLNDALIVIDPLLQCRVITIDLLAPPSTNSDGDLYIVAGEGGTATGDWAGEENNLAMYVAEGDSWLFFTAGEQVHYVLNMYDLTFYIFDAGSPGGWTALETGGGGSADSGHGVLTDLTISSNTVNMDHFLGADFDLELTENVTTFNHTNITTGEANWFTLRIHQDGVGSRTFAPPASWTYGSGVAAYTVSSGASDVDLVQGVSYDDGTTWLISYQKDFT